MTEMLWRDECFSDSGELGRGDRPAASSDCEIALNRKSLFAFGSGLLILLAMGGFSYRSIVTLHASDQWVTHTHEILRNLTELLSAVESAESSINKFALTGKEPYLIASQASAVSAGQLEVTLRDLTVDNPQQQDQLPVLENLITQRIRFGNRVISLRQAKGLETATDVVGRAPAAQLTLKIQAVIHVMQGEEIRLLTLRDADARRRLRQSNSIQIAGVGLLLLVATVSCWSALRLGRERDDARRINDLEAKYRGLMEAAPDAMVLVDAGEEIVLLNSQAEKQFGYTRDELIGQKIEHIIPEGFAERLIADAKRSPAEASLQHMGSGLELVGQRKDGGRFPVEIMLSPLKSDEGVLITAAIRDISERKKTESRLLSLMESEIIRKQEMQLKDDFLSQVSHELRSPLTAVRQFVTILLDGLAGELVLEQRRYLEIVLRNVRQLHSMINDLFEVSALQAGKLKVDLQCTSLSDAVTYAVGTLQESALAKGIVLSSDIEPKLPSICGDPTRIRQILVILGDNAIKFTPPSGSINIRVRVFDKDPAFLLMEIADSGRGISPDMIERIFERLFQVPDPASEERKGLGLGLYICRELVTRQAGQIWVKNGPERGAVFSVTLPIISLTRLIAPAFEEPTRSERLFTLVATEIGSQTGWLSDRARAEHCSGIRDLLQGCLHSDRDILLPKMEAVNTASEVFFVLAMTDAIGGEAISKRIGQQLTYSKHLEQAGLTHSTSYRSIDAIQRNATESKDELLSRVTASIQGLMNEHTSTRQALHA